MNPLVYIVFGAMIIHGIILLSADSEWKNKEERITGLQFFGLWMIIVIICSFLWIIIVIIYSLIGK